MKSNVVWKETYDAMVRKWWKRVLVINLAYLLLIGAGLGEILKVDHKDNQIVRLTEKNDEYKIRYDIFNILKLKGLSLGQGMDIADILIKRSKDLDLPIQLCMAVINKESEYYPNAKSHAGAMGLMQLMPETFDIYNKALKLGLTRSAAYDPIVNVTIATQYLHDLLVEFRPQYKNENELWKKVLNRYSGGAVGYAEKVKKMEKELVNKIGTPVVMAEEKKGTKSTFEKRN